MTGRNDRGEERTFEEMREKRKQNETEGLQRVTGAGEVDSSEMMSPFKDSSPKRTYSCRAPSQKCVLTGRILRTLRSFI